MLGSHINVFGLVFLVLASFCRIHKIKRKWCHHNCHISTATCSHQLAIFLASLLYLEWFIISPSTPSSLVSSRSSSCPCRREHKQPDVQLQSMLESFQQEMTANNTLLFNKLGKFPPEWLPSKARTNQPTGSRASPLSSPLWSRISPSLHSMPQSRFSTLLRPRGNRVSQVPRGRVLSITKTEQTEQSPFMRTVAVRRPLLLASSPEIGLWKKLQTTTLVESESTFDDAAPLLFSASFQQKMKDHMEALRNLKQASTSYRQSRQQSFWKGYPQSSGEVATTG